jgi:hypothetical protein
MGSEGRHGGRRLRSAPTGWSEATPQCDEGRPRCGRPRARRAHIPVDPYPPRLLISMWPAVGESFL